MALPEFWEVVLDRKKTEFETESSRDFAERNKLSFNDYLLLSRALTHRSYLNEHPEALEDNERLEFLGDAVLDFIVGAWLYNHYPEMAEGELTRMRSALVYTDQLARFAKKINLGNALKLGKGESNGGGRERRGLLCDGFEALIGALYLDSGIDAVTKFIAPLLEEESEYVLNNYKTNDSKSQFQEWAQSKGYPTPLYVTIGENGPDHSKEFEVVVKLDDKVYGSGMGNSKQSAAKAAAEDALRKINK